MGRAWLRESKETELWFEEEDNWCSEDWVDDDISVKKNKKNQEDKGGSDTMTAELMQLRRKYIEEKNESCFSLYQDYIDTSIYRLSKAVS